MTPTYMKKTILSFFLMIAVMTTWAGPVTQEEAKAKAVSFLKENSTNSVGSKKAPYRNMQLQPIEYNRLHVFNIGENEGFIIASSDDRTKDILGYSNNGSFDIDNLPGNIKGWLYGYCLVIEALETGDITIPEDHTNIKQSPKKARANVNYLIKTAWDQVAPYNDNCPYYEMGNYKGNCLTGCGAVAMAQVMYYYQLPKSSTALPSYTTAAFSIFVDELPAIDFDWANMLPAYDGKNYTEAQGKAIAQLLRYCGQSVEMDYQLGGSFSSVSRMPGALKNFFGYDADVKYLQRGWMDDAEWEDILYNEIASGRPVIYSGQKSQNDRHIFVCDGYDNGFYHVNWGWGGYCDGYYAINVMNPDEVGYAVDLSAGYNAVQEMCIGIQPENGVDETNHQLTVQSFTFGSEGWDFNLANMCGIDGDYNYAIGCVDKDGKVLNIFWDYEAPFRVNSWRTRSYNYWVGYLTSQFGTGTFYVTPVCKLVSQTEYQPCTNWMDHLYKVVFDGSSETIGKVHGFGDDSDVKTGDINTDGEVNVTDVVTLISYIAKNDFSSVDKSKLDLNGDGNVDVTDVVTLIIMIGNGK